MNCPHCGNEIVVNRNGLTPREKEVADVLTSSDLPYRELFATLGYKDTQPLQNIASAIYSKLGVHSRNELRAVWKKTDEVVLVER